MNKPQYWGRFSLLGKYQYREPSPILREQLLNLRARVLQAEEERLRGVKTMSVSEAREALRKL